MLRPALLAAVLLSAPALAQEVATPIAVSDTATYRGTLDGGTDEDRLSVRLEAGRDYAVAMADYADARIEVIDPSRRVVASFLTYDDQQMGAEVRAAVTGTYTVRITAAEPSSYAIRVENDCPRTTATRCTFRVGQTARGRSWSSSDDADASRVRLEAGRTYSATVTGHPLLEKAAHWLDLRGRTLASCVGFSGSASCTVRLRPTRSGTYILRAANGDDEAGAKYDLALR